MWRDIFIQQTDKIDWFLIFWRRWRVRPLKDHLLFIDFSPFFSCSIKSIVECKKIIKCSMTLDLKIHLAYGLWLYIVYNTANHLVSFYWKYVELKIIEHKSWDREDIWEVRCYIWRQISKTHQLCLPVSLSSTFAELQFFIAPYCDSEEMSRRCYFCPKTIFSYDQLLLEIIFWPLKTFSKRKQNKYAKYHSRMRPMEVPNPILLSMMSCSIFSPLSLYIQQNWS